MLVFIIKTKQYNVIDFYPASSFPVLYHYSLSELTEHQLYNKIQDSLYQLMIYLYEYVFISIPELKYLQINGLEIKWYFNSYR